MSAPIGILRGAVADGFRRRGKGDRIMCYYVRVEDLAANALIELLEKNPNTREVSIKALEKYGIEVIKLLEANDGEKGVLLLSRGRVLSMVKECSDLLGTKNIDAPNASIVLRGDKSSEEYIEELVNRFCGSINVAVLDAMEDESTLQVLLNAA